MFENSHLPIRIYRRFANLCSYFQSIFILVLRLIWGYQFFLKGLSKVQNISGFENFLIDLGFLAPTFSAYLVAYAELILGVFLLVGFLGRASSLVLAIIMFTAYSTAHVEVLTLEIFTNPIRFVQEAPFPYLFTSLVVLFFGPGIFSIDGWALRSVDKKENYPY